LLLLLLLFLLLIFVAGDVGDSCVVCMRDIIVVICGGVVVGVDAVVGVRVIVVGIWLLLYVCC